MVRPSARTSDVLGQRPHEVQFDFERRPRFAFRDGREDRAAERRVEQRRGKAAVHGADWIVVAIVWHALEDRAAVCDFDQVRAEQLADQRMRLLPQTMPCRKSSPLSDLSTSAFTTP